ncbi:MAG: FAD binding domain-containing protein [Bacteroidia bacterium]|nr:FAD binding domain-containing protein [Bacteroidia bacterium]
MGTAFEISSAQFIKEHYPVLHQAAFGLGSYQIRQVATIGGNICTASPSGDMANALVALKARCEILNADGRIRIIPIENFFLDVRKTDLKKNEVLQSILLEKNTGEKLYSGYIKVGTRRSMECSVVSLAYHIVSDNSETIVKAGISIGASAPTIKFAASASEYLLNRKLSSISSDEASHFAEKVMEYASPISDIRATAWYRKEALFNICKSIFDTFDKLKTCSAL